MLAIFGSDRLPQRDTLEDKFSTSNGSNAKSRCNEKKGGIGNPEFVLGEVSSSSLPS